MVFSPITHIRHFDIAVPDFEKQIEFYKNHWGLTVQARRRRRRSTSPPRDRRSSMSDSSTRAAEKRLDLVASVRPTRQSVDDLLTSSGGSGVKLV